MRTLSLLLTLGVAGFAATPMNVTIYVTDRASVPTKLLNDASARASALLASAGVRLEWRHGKPAAHSDCRRSIVLTIEETTPPDVNPGAPAFTGMRDGAITVVYERIRPVLANWRSLAPAFLAHVIAHEIGHSLERLDFHPESGIMKARWTAAEYHDIEEGHLRFTPTDAGLMRAGVESSCPAL